MEPDLLQMQSGAGNRATTEAVQRAKGTRGPFRERIAALLDRFKKNLEPIDTWIKGVQNPTNAAFTQQATASANEGLKESAAISGTAAASGNLLTELPGTVVSGVDAYKNAKDARAHKTGAKHHTAARKAKTKGADTLASATSSAAYSAGIAKEATKVQKVAEAAMASEVGGGLSAAAGFGKGGRALFRAGGAARKYKKVKDLGDPRLLHAESLARLEEARVEANWAAARAYVALDSYWEEGGEVQLDTLGDAVDDAWEAMSGAQDAAESLQRAERDVETLSTAQNYAKKKQATKIGKEAVGGVLGETTKGAAGVVTAVAVGTGLASNPVGWGLAGAGAGLVLGVTLYKALRAATKRYDEVHHPERYVAEGETATDAASRTKSLEHALKFWKKVSKGERQLMAREIYRLAAGPDVPGSAGTTDEMRASARALLVALKAGPTDHKLEPEAWAASLNDKAGSAGWIKEITEQLASG
ncbi:hypothetical protein [Streptomyces sp. NPDC003717]|uniref:hypothetical protein n=1 Tax=Streptomyces sp. NPDC003717 TaxID=3154276 RepID=UPI00339FE1BD